MSPPCHPIGVSGPCQSDNNQMTLFTKAEVKYITIVIGCFIFCEMDLGGYSLELQRPASTNRQA